VKVFKGYEYDNAAENHVRDNPTHDVRVHVQKHSGHENLEVKCLTEPCEWWDHVGGWVEEDEKRMLVVTFEDGYSATRTLPQSEVDEIFGSWQEIDFVAKVEVMDMDQKVIKSWPKKV
jgi:hypothetical protein